MNSTAPALTKTTTKVTGNTAVNVFDCFWLLAVGDGTVDIHTVDPSNTYDDIALGGCDVRDCSPEAAAEHCGHSVVLDQAARDQIVEWLS